MRLTIPATLIGLGCCFLLSSYSIGCAEPQTPPSFGGSGGTGGTETGGGGGAVGGEGGGGPPPCVPTQEECDGVDNDCDMKVDEDCPCINGQTQSCYSGPEGTKGVGPCTAGQQTCDKTGKWGPCIGQVTPKMKETCNAVDDDCNGSVDDMGMTTCGVGACQVTVVTCENGKLNPCNPGTATLEVCDGIDNNCNQLIDETFPGKGEVCASGLLGACASGMTACTNGKASCVPDVMPVTETCNDIDDDCDGMVDDGIAGTGFACGTGLLGVCALGTFSCKNTKVDCYPNIASSAEKCNGLDDDCDGTADDGNPEANVVCNTGMAGECSVGTTSCANGMLLCTSNLSNKAESCNGIDDNCNGTTDENNPGGGVPCGCGGTRACVNGKLACQGGPVVFLEEDFSNAVGWSLDNEWEIKPTVTPAVCNDPTVDTSSSADNMIAGVKVGGCADVSLHDHYFLTSPVMNTAGSPKVILTFQRWLRSDIAPYMNHVVQVYNGAAWYPVYDSGGAGATDTAWTKVTIDLTVYRNANMRVRWGVKVGSVGATASGSWNIDDVRVMSDVCP